MSSNLVLKLSEAESIVREAGVPDELKSAAFTEILKTLIADNVDSRKSSQPVKSAVVAEEGELNEVELIERLQQHFAGTPDEIGHVFYLEDGTVKTSVNASQLGSNTTQRAQRLALLVLAGLQGSGLQAVTPQSEVRARAELLKVYDSKNFATTIGKMSDKVTIRGTGPKRGLVLKPKGYEEVQEIIHEILGGA